MRLNNEYDESLCNEVSDEISDDYSPDDRMCADPRLIAYLLRRARRARHDAMCAERRNSGYGRGDGGSGYVGGHGSYDGGGEYERRPYERPPHERPPHKRYPTPPAPSDYPPAPSYSAPEPSYPSAPSYHSAPAEYQALPVDYQPQGGYAGETRESGGGGLVSDLLSSVLPE